MQSESIDSEFRQPRASQRYGLELAIAFRRTPGTKENDVLLGKTRNISTRGIYFTTNHVLAANELLDFSITFPSLAQGADVVIAGRARVLRTARKSGTSSEPIEVAALIDEYRILQPESFNRKVG